MKTTIKRHRRMTKHRKHGKHGKHGKGTTKCMTKSRKSIRKTRRQSGGWGWKSFIPAGENPIAPVANDHNDPELLLEILSSKGKGIDVKVKTDATGQRMWLIGGDRLFDATFDELRDGAKDGRYKRFINVLLNKYPSFNNFEDMKLKKGIKLTNQQFCKLFIDENYGLNYPELKKRFRERNFTCSIAAPMSAAGTSAAPMSAYHPPSSAVQSYWQRTQPEPFTPLSDIRMNSAGTAMPPQLQEWPQPSAAFRAATQQQPVSTKYFATLKRIKDMNLENVTDQMIVNALNDANGNADTAINKLMDAQSAAVIPSGPSAPVRPSGPMPIQQIAPQYAPVSTAVAFGAEQAFPVRNLSFKPKIADLMFPDVFVEKYANAYKLQFDQQESYHKDTHGRTLINFTACPDIADWTVMSTIGDGNCLTHAFLQCTSSMYREIHVNNEEIPDEKIAVAQAFRLEFARINDPKFLLDENPNIMREFTDGNGRTDLGEGTFASYARLFGVILVVFDVRNKQVMVANLTQETAIQNMPVIFIHGDGGHYSSVLPIRPSVSKKPFVLYYQDAKMFECLKKPLTFPNEAALNE